MLNALTFMCCCFFETHIFREKTLQLPAHLFKLLSRIHINKSRSLLKSRHFVLSRAKEILKLNNTINRPRLFSIILSH